MDRWDLLERATKREPRTSRRVMSKTREALVIHPILSYYAGAEFLCLCVCKALLDNGYHVKLVSGPFESAELERMFGMSSVMEKCEHVLIPQFRPVIPKLAALQRLSYSKKVWSFLKGMTADIAFSTQSSPFIVSRRMFHFVYNIRDLFNHPLGASPLAVGSWHPGGIGGKILTSVNEVSWRKHARFPHWFFAVGSHVLKDLRSRGYNNSSLVLPPCRTDFEPRFPKRNQIIQVGRLIPDKDWDLFFRVAQRLPEFRFVMMGRDQSDTNRQFPGYASRLVSTRPKNVDFVNAVVRERPELLGESKAFLYTGIERGVVMAPVEAMAAGCVPLARPNTGAADMIAASGIGKMFESVEDAANTIRTILSSIDEKGFRAISERAKIFSPDAFMHKIGLIAELASEHPDMGEKDLAIALASQFEW